MPNNDTNADIAQPTGPVAGVVAQFDTAQALTAAATRVREEGFRRWDAHSPFPVHGLDRAMGIRMTILPWLVLGAGMSGGAVAVVLQWWTNGVHYPLIISGKPLFSLPANIPVTFELIVLGSALTAFFGALALSLLPQYWHATFSSKAFARVTTDGFFISIDAADPKFDEPAVCHLLKSIGATSVDTCHDPATGRQFPAVIYWALAVLFVLALIPPLVVARMRVTTSSSPRIHLLKDMDSQPKYKAQTASPLFRDGRSNRPQVPGTVARGRLQDDEHLYLGKIEGQWARTFPRSVPLTMDTMRRGRERFDVYCATCHGLTGDGNGMIALRALKRSEPNWVPPLQLYAESVRQQPVGQIFNSITNGVRTMPSYRAQIPAEDRWAIVLYLQALQQCQPVIVQESPEEEPPKSEEAPEGESAESEAAPEAEQPKLE
jgi:mono/diheme cytochrome c family protein